MKREVKNEKEDISCLDACFRDLSEEEQQAIFSIYTSLAAFSNKAQQYTFSGLYYVIYQLSQAK